MDAANSVLLPFLAERYTLIRSTFPTEGRRRLNLRVVEQFWALLSTSEGSFVPQSSTLSPELLEGGFFKDADPYDDVSSDALELGIVIRTDYSDESAWDAFCLRLQDGEKEFIAASEAADDDVMVEDGAADNHEMDGDDDERDDDDGEPSPIFRVINPSSLQDRALFTDISNLTALRLLTEVDIRPSPTLPTGSSRLKTPNRLVDYGGFQEVYHGKHLWIYDTKSNSDQCVRLISHAGEMYGTAT